MTRAVDARILEEAAENLSWHEIRKWIADDNRPAERFRARLHHGNRLRQAIFVDKERVRLRCRNPVRHGHRFGCSGCLVKQRRVGDVEARQVADEGLEIQQRFEAALADFRLIRRIGRIPRRVLENIALDSGRHGGAVIALTDQRGQKAVLVGRRPELVERAPL